MSAGGHKLNRTVVKALTSYGLYNDGGGLYLQITKGGQSHGYTDIRFLIEDVIWDWELFQGLTTLMLHELMLRRPGRLLEAA
jgi:hypothetical protein